MHHIVRYIALFHVIQQINAIFPCPFSFYYKVEEKVPVWFLAVIALGSSAFLFVCFCVFFFNFWERSSKNCWELEEYIAGLVPSAVQLLVPYGCQFCAIVMIAKFVWIQHLANGCVNTTLQKCNFEVCLLIMLQVA